MHSTEEHYRLFQQKGEEVEMPRSEEGLPLHMESQRDGSEEEPTIRWQDAGRAAFPEFARKLDQHEDDYHAYMFFGELRGLACKAHLAGDEATLRRVHGFVEWALDHKDRNIWNPAGIGFYESFLDFPECLKAAVPWLSPYVIWQVWDLWEFMAELGDDVDEKKRLLQEVKAQILESGKYSAEVLARARSEWPPRPEGA